MIRPVSPYTHSLRVLPLHNSLSTYLWPCAILFHEFFMRETPTLTLRRHHLEIHIGEVHIVSFSTRHVPLVLNFIKSFKIKLNPRFKVNIYHEMFDNYPNQRLVVTH